ncbi:30S ribosomal protein S3 [Natranaerobius thermophilus]|uniref:Small ribosomal subunit protein uS3 n=1 Tax=Natranaerobius thermophilus (strain ATCC BAA-1301 / DSM 18059 / JW/NM-WN-LF) TaxID=457570 RepID=RS3_NATTJ|nr:30S ribosomal protein S3 [Natranaerobius thermophilus]B2A4E5.1 RecName: Full=Small ribosomal subunit protein uS3; AltName: Full=30S ribosomal protein S3 [Natranaerobius thermophilus JW/NM-WN-LF]ACB83799.1 SSU ribosomal protein S3P [Natranaerobius thermophilus JW/NM-WN-LF]
MGQKINPIGLRIGVIKDWQSNWYADKNYTELVHEDIKIREYIENKLFNADVSAIQIDRAANRIKVTLHTAKPGMVIGKGGSGVEKLRSDIENLTGKKVHINVMEVKTPELDAHLAAKSIAIALERRVAFRRAMKQAVGRAMRQGAKGIKVMCSGRLGGAEMSRTEWYTEGNVPLQTLRADIDYGMVEANTAYGQIGVKCWINKGEVLPEVDENEETKEENKEKSEEKSE